MGSAGVPGNCQVASMRRQDTAWFLFLFPFSFQRCWTTKTQNYQVHSRPMYHTTCRSRLRGAGLRLLYDISALHAETCPTYIQYPQVTVALPGTIAWIPPDCINRKKEEFTRLRIFDDGLGASATAAPKKALGKEWTTMMTTDG